MTIQLSKGANAPLPDSANRVSIVVGWSGGPGLDASALMLTESGRVRTDDDFVFYNQPSSTDGSVTYAGKSATSDTLIVDVARVPSDIQTVAIAASADGRPFSSVIGLYVGVYDDAGVELMRFDISDAAAETAFVFGEVYRRQGAWKFRAVGQGWSSGLAGLATSYGITVEDSAPPPPAPGPPPAPVMSPGAVPSPAPPPGAGAPVQLAKAVRLEKQLAGQPPAIVSLVKTAGVSLEKKGLADHRARVALCLDISASMTSLYRAGKVQQLCERILALAVQLDDDGACDVFTFGTGGYDEGPLDLQNHQGWVDQLLRRRRLEGGTNYGLAMQAVRRHYFPDAAGGARSAPLPDTLPVYVMFVTDGQTTDQKGTRNQVLWSSYEPLFWQFMAIGKSSRNVTPAGATPPRRRRGSRFLGGDFEFLEELDDMPGRYVDNADFFSVADPAGIADAQLYDLMMTEYPDWLALCRQNGLLRS